MFVCNEDWETRHPQSMIKTTIEHTSVPFSRPEPKEVFLPSCTIPGLTALPGYAIPGCSIPLRAGPLE